MRVFPIKVDLLERIGCLSTGSHAPRCGSPCAHELLKGLLGKAVGVKRGALFAIYQACNRAAGILAAMVQLARFSNE